MFWQVNILTIPEIYWRLNPYKIFTEISSDDREDFGRRDIWISAAKILPRSLNLGGQNLAEISPRFLNLGGQNPAANLLRRISRKEAILF